MIHSMVYYNNCNILYCRLGGGPNDYKDVMSNPFFKSINIDDLLAKKVRQTQYNNYVS